MPAAKTKNNAKPKLKAKQTVKAKAKNVAAKAKPNSKLKAVAKPKLISKPKFVAKPTQTSTTHESVFARLLREKAERHAQFQKQSGQTQHPHDSQMPSNHARFSRFAGPRRRAS